MKRHWLIPAVVALCALGCQTLETEKIGSGPKPGPEALQERSGKSLITLKTADVFHAGTDSWIQARLNPEDPWITLDNAGNDRERDDEDFYWVQFPPGRTGTYLYLRTNSRGVGPSWKLSWVEVAHPNGPKQKTIWNQWLGSTSKRGTWCEYTSQGPIPC